VTSLPSSSGKPLAGHCRLRQLLAGPDPSAPSSSGKSLNRAPLAELPLFLQSPHHRGSRSTITVVGGYFGIRDFSPLIIGEVAQPAQITVNGTFEPSVPSSSGKSLNTCRQTWCNDATLQSPHHRGSRSTAIVGVTIMWGRVFVLQSPHHRGSRSTHLCCRSQRPDPSVPSSSGKSLNHAVFLRDRPVQVPSVPSSSGKSLNSTLQKASSGAGFWGGLKNPLKPHAKPDTFRVRLGTWTSEISLIHAGFRAVEKGPGVFGPKELLQRRPIGSVPPAAPHDSAVAGGADDGTVSIRR
jgi:hypothetical protein